MIMINKLLILISIIQISLFKCSNFEIQNFQDDKFTDFNQFHIVDNERKLIVGSRDYLLQFELDNISKPIDVVNLAPNQNIFNQCIVRGQSKDSCHNFILVLLTLKNSSINLQPKISNLSLLIDNQNESEEFLLVCGTNAAKPQCTAHSLNNLSKITKTIDGSLLCPFSNQHQFTLENFNGDQIYFAGPTDLLAKNKILVRNTINLKNDKKNFIQTQIDNSKMLFSDSKFIYSFETKKYVYFLFKETAVEDLICTQKVISRIGRICKNDLGFKSSMGRYFNTFLKAKINCQFKRDNKTTYFDELIDANYVDSKLFIIFRNQNFLGESIVCAYELNEIEKQFNDSFSFQTNSDSIWSKHEDRAAMKQFECNLPNKNNKFELTNLQQYQRKYQIIYKSVTNIKLNHLLIDNSYFNFEKIQIDSIKELKSKLPIYVIYLITDNNQLVKFILNLSDKKVCFFDNIELPLNKNEKILKFKFNKKLILIGSTKQLIKVQISNCKNYKSKFTCLNSGDLYCIWNNLLNECDFIHNLETNSNLDNYEQPDFLKFCNLNKPKIEMRLAFDKDVKCFINDDLSKQCYCNYDLNKSNPKPFQISCKIDDQLSSYSPFSTCLNGKKQRTRKCTEPKNDGLQCVGNSIEYENCLSLIETNEWSNCSFKCGYQLRNKIYLYGDEKFNFTELKTCELSDNKNQQVNDSKCITESDYKIGMISNQLNQTLINTEKNNELNDKNLSYNMVTIKTLLIYCILLYIFGLISGIILIYFYNKKDEILFKRESTKNLSLRSVSSPLIRADKNTYVTNENRKSELNHTRSPLTSLNASSKSYKTSFSNNSSIRSKFSNGSSFIKEDNF